jgi:hypothetical protein
MRLFGCACCQRIEDLFPDEGCRVGVAVAEQFADGEASHAALATAYNEALNLQGRFGPESGQYASYYATHACWCVTTVSSASSANAWYGAASARQMQRMVEAREALPAPASHPVMRSAMLAETQAIATVLRDVFGNPFRAATVDPSWLTADVLLLARGIYTDRAFDRMPILADALQDAGCGNDTVLNHCRDVTRAHVRGCWVVDLVLGKS